MGNKQSFYAVIPHFILTDKKLSSTAKLVYGEISALANKEGYCFASNAHFAKIFGLTTRSISTSISGLVEEKHIRLENEKTGLANRRIHLLLQIPTKKTSEPMTKTSIPHEENFSRRITISNTKRDIYSNIYMCYKEKIEENARLTDKAREKIKTRLKEFKEEDLLKAITNFSKDSWWMKHNAHRGIAWFFHSEDRMLQLIHMTPRQTAPKYIKIS